MRFHILAAAGIAALAAPAFAQSSSTFPEEADREIIRSLPSPDQVEDMADVAGSAAEAILDVPIGGVVRAIDPSRRVAFEGALNTAFAEDGVLIHVTGQVARPIHLVYHHVAETSDALLHHLVKVEPGASLMLLESGPAAARFNSVTEVDVAEGGTLHHVRTQGRDHQRRTDDQQPIVTKPFHHRVSRSTSRQPMSRRQKPLGKWILSTAV